MEYFTGLDVGMDETAVCVVDEKGSVALQVSVVTDPDAIKAALKPYLGRLRRVGHEAGALSPWLHPKLLKLGLWFTNARYARDRNGRTGVGRSVGKLRTNS